MSNLTFCPYDGNCLYVARAPPDQEDPEGANALTCRVCPYQFKFKGSLYERTYLKPKQRADILGQNKSELPINEVPGGCKNEKCSSTRAYFYQLQTRSADEPPTSFYTCVECSKQWQEY